MPNRNHRGPADLGPATGRGHGPCGRGAGHRHGQVHDHPPGCRRGLGMGLGWIEHLPPEEQRYWLEQRRALIDQRLAELAEVTAGSGGSEPS